MASSGYLENKIKRNTARKNVGAREKEEPMMVPVFGM
jgi:hypothetical protein